MNNFPERSINPPEPVFDARLHAHCVECREAFDLEDLQDPDGEGLRCAFCLETYMGSVDYQIPLMYEAESRNDQGEVITINKLFGSKNVILRYEDGKINIQINLDFVSFYNLLQKVANEELAEAAARRAIMAAAGGNDD